MARIFITGSADGLGLLAAQSLIGQGHQVVLHARNRERGLEALKKVPGSEAYFIADLSNIEETKKLAYEVNRSGKFDAVIHNAGVYRAPSHQIFAVNILAPYILTCLIHRPKRLIYLSSGMHRQGRARFENFTQSSDNFEWSDDFISYSDSKLHVLMLSMAVARKWPDVFSNAVDPGWVPTKMGSRGAPDDLKKGYETQVWLAVSNDEGSKVSGSYFFHQKERPCNPIAHELTLQEKLLKICEVKTGVPFSVTHETIQPENN